MHIKADLSKLLNLLSAEEMCRKGAPSVQSKLQLLYRHFW